MTFKYKKINLNNAVKVKLNEIGHAEMERQHNELYEGFGLKYRPFTRKEADDKGYSTFQLHCLMNTFGHMMICGGDLPFDSASVFIPELTLKDCEL